MKFTLKHSSHRAAALGAMGALFLAGTAFGSPVPSNLGSGLDVLVRERLAQQAAEQAGRKGSGAVDAQLLSQAQSYRDNAMVNEADQVKVYIHLAPREGKARFVPESVLPATAKMTATDMSYRNGVVEAWVSLDDIIGLAKDKRVSSVILAIKPVLDVGAATTQGVVQHRINLQSQDGTGITVGTMSDTFGKFAAVTPAMDVASGDLPGPGNPLGNTTPVAVIDDPGAGNNTDEGRAMTQIVHDIAPKAKLGFATASTGQVSFADNIKSLANRPGLPGSHAQAGFQADVIVDDLFYSDSPMFGTSMVGKAINDVAAAGVSYFSSAGNRPAQQAYFSDYRNVSSADLATALAGTNIPVSAFSTIPAAEYAAGFHNFRTDGGQDIAQTVTNFIAGQASNMTFQWDEAFDKITAGTEVFNQAGNFTGTPSTVDVIVALTGGVPTRIVVSAPLPSTFDAVVTILDPSSAVLVNAQDTGTDETIFFTPSVSGNYTVRIGAFGGTTGNYLVQAFANSAPSVVTDYNLYFFRSDTGAFIKKIAVNNKGTNQPMEFGALTFTPAGAANIQMVIGRASGDGVSTKIRYVNTGFAGPGEYFDYQTPVTYGHNHEAGCISAAAYSPFRPFVPEEFTSPGPSLILFDQDGNRLATPIIRQKPDVAAMDGGNNTFFSADATSDADTLPNFYGTSAAAPHAAGIGALVLQAHGGPGSVTQPQMRTILQRAGFLHDLDPFFSSGTARAGTGKITMTMRGNHGNFNLSDGRLFSTTDPNMGAVSYVGPNSIASLSINLQAGNTTGGTEANVVPGLMWDSRAFSTASTAGFPFTVGKTTGTLLAGDITANYSLPATAPAVGQVSPNVGQFYQLDLTFAAGKFAAGNSFTFGADRDEQRTAPTPAAGPTGGASALGNSADLFGATVSIPEGTVSAGGATFSGLTGDAQAFSGTFTNKIGKGYSPLDGYGFINAQDAVAQPLP